MAKEYVERKRAIVDACNSLELYPSEYAELENALNSIPAADVAPVRHGGWLNFYGDFSTAECELCAELYEVSPDESPQKEYFDAFKEFYRYCPNCGAYMMGENNGKCE